MTEATAFSAEELDSIRGEFPHLTDRIYLNHASVGPLPLRARREIDQINSTLQSLDRDFDAGTFEAAGRARAALATLVGGAPAEIGLVPNTSFGLNWAFAAFALKAGDAVLITDHEFPALVYTALNLRRLGVEIVVAPVPPHGGLTPDQLEALYLAHPNIKVVAVSWVNFHNGFRHDVRELARVAHHHGAYLLVDAIQGLGTRPLNAAALGIDVLAAAVHKWLMCPVGLAFVWCRSQLFRELDSPWAGWLSVEWDVDFSNLFDSTRTLAAGPRRAEVGTPNFAGVRALAVVAEWIAGLGTDRICAHTQGLLDLLDETLDSERFAVVSDRSAQHRSSVYCIRPRSGSAAALRAHLRERGIVAAVREGALRISPHFPNRRSDLEQLAQSLHEFA